MGGQEVIEVDLAGDDFIAVVGHLEEVSSRFGRLMTAANENDWNHG